MRGGWGEERASVVRALRLLMVLSKTKRGHVGRRGRASAAHAAKPARPFDIRAFTQSKSNTVSALSSPMGVSNFKADLFHNNRQGMRVKKL